MEQQTNGTSSPQKKKNVLFSIGSYSSNNAPVINKISKNGTIFESDSSCPPPMPTTWNSRRRPVSLDLSDDASCRRNGYSTLPRIKSTHQNGILDKPCPPAARFDRIPEHSGPVDKPSHPPGSYKRSMSLEPEQLQHSGRVALTIAAYEGEARTPTRLEFLPQTRISRSNSKVSSVASTPVVEEVDFNSRLQLQNELTATLMRSNLRKKNDEEAAVSPSVQENGKVDKLDAPPEEPKESPKKVNGIDDQAQVQAKDGEDEKNQVEEIQPKEAQVEKPNQDLIEVQVVVEKHKSVVEEVQDKKNGDDKAQEMKVQNENNKDEKVQSDQVQNEDKKVPDQEVQDEFKFTNGNVKKLADVLGQKMTFKLNPEVS